MVLKDIVWLAEQECLRLHEGQRRKGGIQEPYPVHTFAVRDLLVRYGYDDAETQAIALLHDTIEDTALVNDKSRLEKMFGAVVYHGVYVLSRNTLGRHVETVAPLFAAHGVPLVDQDGTHLTPEAYKIRLLFSPATPQRVKIADMIDNTRTITFLKTEGIERKLKDAEEFYIPLGRAVAPLMVRELEENIANYQASRHYHETFGK